MTFLDQNKPIATCISETCDNCTVCKTLHCHFTLRDLIYFLLIVSPSFFPDFRLSIVFANCLSSNSCRLFYDIKNVSLFPVYKFRMSTEYG